MLRSPKILSYVNHTRTNKTHASLLLFKNIYLVTKLAISTQKMKDTPKAPLIVCCFSSILSSEVEICFLPVSNSEVETNPKKVNVFSSRKFNPSEESKQYSMRDFE
mmetsp:Transcript_16533/g.37151  ORF Transcript_16533/g.37151 Transcript_16533/m.37151 type:complete len:106 (-) Transcript_16533:664-981(-)